MTDSQKDGTVSSIQTYINTLLIQCDLFQLYTSTMAIATYFIGRVFLCLNIIYVAPLSVTYLLSRQFNFLMIARRSHEATTSQILMGTIWVFRSYFILSWTRRWRSCTTNSTNNFFDVQNWIVTHDDVIKWQRIARNWPFVRGIHRPPVNSPHKGQ